MESYSNINAYGHDEPSQENLIQIISKVVIKLKELALITEDKFIKCGTLLNKNHNSIQNIVTNTKNTISLISSEDLSESINSLEKIIDELSDSISISKDKLTQSRKSITEINENIELISERIENFNGFIKRLRMLGLSTKIESARIGQTSNGFQNLAGNVESLSNKIETKTKSIHSKSNGLLKLISEVSEKAVQLHDQNNNVERNSFEKIKQNISLFSKKIIDAKNNSEDITKYSSQIAKILSGLISSFQYQDISKQQIDHVCSALKGIEKENHTKAENFGEWTSTAYNVFSIQYAQTQNTRDEFLRATGDMIRKLKEIHELMSSLQKMNAELLDINDGKHNSFISSIEVGIEDITAILKKNTDGVNEIIGLLKKVNDTVNLLSSFVNEVEDIDEDIELISMNAQIKAARLGGEGAALGVLAQNIQQLSVATKLETNAITSNFNSVNEQSDLLNKLLVTSSENLKHLSNESINKDLNKIFMQLHDVQSSLMSNFNSTGYLIKELHSNFSETESLSEFHSNAENILEEVIRELERGVAALSVEHKKNPEANEHISKLKENYTMQSEREIHESIYDRKNVKVDPKISESPKSDDDFGDNVDLF